jgi:hypothetical protein
MAKRKAALFEVFNSTRSTSSPSKPRWRLPWFNGENGNGHEAVERVVVEPDPEPAAPSRPSVRVSVDSVDQTISLVLSYGTAAVSGFALVVIMGLAFVLGRHAGRGPLPLLADRTTEEVRLQPPRGDVLDIVPDVVEPRAVTAQTPAPRNAKGPTFNDPAKAPATLTVSDERRTIGFNYVIIQSYPDRKDAEEARQVLLKHNILCTIEATPSNWADPKWKMVSVIGTKGFDRIHSKEFEDYVAQIQKVSDEMASKSKFKRFEPKPYKWRDPKAAGGGS